MGCTRATLPSTDSCTEPPTMATSTERRDHARPARWPAPSPGRSSWLRGEPVAVGDLGDRTIAQQAVTLVGSDHGNVYGSLLRAEDPPSLSAVGELFRTPCGGPAVTAGKTRPCAPSTAGFACRGTHAQRTPQPESAVAHGERRSSHPPALEVTQHVGPGLGRLPVAVGDGHQAPWCRQRKDPSARKATAGSSACSLPGSRRRTPRWPSTSLP